MRLNKLVIGLGILFLLIITLSYVSNALIGCCCDPVSFNGTFEDDATCSNKNFIFAGVPPAGKTCSEFCNATQAIPTPANITLPVGCGTPGFTAPPYNFVVSPVKGKKEFKLSFSLPCDADYVDIYRCKGSDCSGFSSIDTISANSPYFDMSAELEFDIDYTYKIMAHYSHGSDSDPAFASNNLGDLECWNKKDDSEFCISEYYYENFRNYLEANGYKSRSASSFSNDFTSAVNAVFTSKFNKAWSCNDNNLLFQKLGAVSCSQSQICISDTPRARCITPGVCEQGGIFGLFSSKTSCESQDYCFFDKSKTNVDSCFECSPRMGCGDYRSKTACEANICSVGECKWTDVYSSIGVGVCIDERFDNCPLCSQAPPTSISNNEAYNEVFDACTPAKAAALSTQEYECFFNKNILDAVSCSNAVCDDFSRSQCGSPANGIQLGADNQITSASSDSCNIGVCYYSDTDNRCFKDADANQVPDCNDRDCEKDFFPPETNIFPAGASGRHDFLKILIRDRVSKNDPGKEITGQQGYSTFVCEGICDNSDSFTFVNSTELNVNDLELKDGTRTIANLESGQNTLYFFSVDPNKNVEIVKSVNFLACDNCAGPKILDFIINRGNVVENDYYTNNKRPVFKIVFNEPAEIVSAGLVFGTNAFAFDIKPESGFNHEYFLTPLIDLPDAKYLFSLNAKDENNLFMTVPLNFNLTIDTVFPNVILSPGDNVFFDEGKVNVTISINEPNFLNASINDIVFTNNYVAKYVPTDIKHMLDTDDDLFFSGLVTGISAGKKALVAIVSDYAGNKVIADSIFFISTGVPDFRLKSPSFGVSSTPVFDVIVESTDKAECRYVYNMPIAPPASEFSHLARFDITGDTEHVLRDITIPADNKSKHLLYVYCKGEDFDASRKTFELTIDDSAPNITNAFVYPTILSDYAGPRDLRFTTSLKVQTSEPTFCRYSNYVTDFDVMENDFPGFGETLKVSHVINITVDQEGNHTYYVECEDIAELRTGPVSVSFLVDTSVPFKAESVSKRYQETSPLYLRIETNKNAFCYYGEDRYDISQCFGDCTFGLSHVQQITKSENGHYQFFVQCNNGAGGLTTDVLEVNISLGIQPPDFILTHCENNILDGSETDIDCGGACPGCYYGLNCVEDSDCEQGLFCVQSVCSEEDSDQDGVSDENDQCPDTPEGEIADVNGCSKSQRDLDGDGMDDSWELQYGLDPEDPDDADKDLDHDGLSNLKEFELGTDPSDKDTDNDGWSDGKEVSKGYDPLNSQSHPKSALMTILIILLIIALAVGIGIGAYYGYKYIKSLPPKKKKLPPLKPLIRPRVEDKFAGLRKMVKPGVPRKPAEKGWVSFENFVERVKRRGGPDIWERMRKVGRVQKKPKIKKEKKDVMSSLRKMARRKR